MSSNTPTFTHDIYEEFDELTKTIRLWDEFELDEEIELSEIISSIEDLEFAIKHSKLPDTTKLLNTELHTLKDILSHFQTQSSNRYNSTTIFRQGSTEFEQAIKECISHKMDDSIPYWVVLDIPSTINKLQNYYPEYVTNYKGYSMI
jgi:hypothetical protein